MRVRESRIGKHIRAGKDERKQKQRSIIITLTEGAPVWKNHRTERRERKREREREREREKRKNKEREREREREKLITVNIRRPMITSFE